ncbi:MAG: hypothetical protein QXR93_05835 [Archaeoglobaceae archaeon]
MRLIRTKLTCVKNKEGAKNFELSRDIASRGSFEEVIEAFKALETQGKKKL